MLGPPPYGKRDISRELRQYRTIPAPTYVPDFLWAMSPRPLPPERSEHNPWHRGPPGPMDAIRPSAPQAQAPASPAAARPGALACPCVPGRAALPAHSPAAGQQKRPAPKALACNKVGSVYEKDGSTLSLSQHSAVVKRCCYAPRCGFAAACPPEPRLPRRGTGGGEPCAAAHGFPLLPRLPRRRFCRGAQRPR